jgi:hypothetical protein
MRTDRSTVHRRRRVLSAWLITLAATAASTSALDAVATAAGVLLVASGLLSGLDHALALGFLAATYVLWGVALRANLGANWSLLRLTGTSTNVLSKAAFELTRRRGARTQRFAAAAGYVATEIAKEAPYYAVAFGAAALTNSVSSNDALIFLAGANLGAAAYEYVLARLTRRLLRRGRVARRGPRATVGPGGRLARRRAGRSARRSASSPTRSRTPRPARRSWCSARDQRYRHVFLAAPKASEIHLADYLPANLEEIERWRARDPGAHHWRAFVRYTLECEGHAAPADEEIARREQLTRSKITRLLQVDARRPVGLDQRYATVISAYCADSATDDRATWATLMANITGLVGPDGLFITAALHRCRSYVVGHSRFPCANVDERDLRRVLAPGFSPRVQVRDLPAHEAQGYSSVLLADAGRHAPDPRPARALRSGILLSGERGL